ncbi:MAG: GNAT family N-acetyltransferase [Pseudomonadota bacterium]
MKDPGISIREAAPEDIGAIMRIEADAFHTTIRESKETFEARIEEFPEGCLILTDEGNMPIGYITSEIWKYSQVVDKESFCLGHSIKDIHDCNGEELYISSMGVLKSRRGNRFGGLLVNTLTEKLLKEHPNIKSSILLVSEKWGNAYKIYKQSGFEDISVLENFFTHDNGQSSNGVVMRKWVR